MACFHPIRAFRPEPDSACRKLIFSKLELAHLEPIKVPCGQCIGCRLDKSRQWAIRCVHEASLHERNSFITLTYAPEHLPVSGSLCKRDFQLFMKRLRKRFGGGVRYYHCGEYGTVCRFCEKSRPKCECDAGFDPDIGRPHYHAALFGLDFDDRELLFVRKGVRIDVSKTLSEIWGLGFCTVGDVNFKSAAYIARYVTKKVNGPLAPYHYDKVLTARFGEILERSPEYCTMSRRPGIGRGWLDKYMADVYPHDRVVLDGRELRPPKYYDAVFQVANPESMEDVKFRRFLRAKDTVSDCTSERLTMRERHQLIAFKLLKRGYENEDFRRL